jgi:hypothetical protein
VGGRRSQRPGPSPTLVSLGPSHHRRHKSRVSLRGPPCALGVSSIPLERCATKARGIGRRPHRISGGNHLSEGQHLRSDYREIQMAATRAFMREGNNTIGGNMIPKALAKIFAANNDIMEIDSPVHSLKKLLENRRRSLIQKAPQSGKGQGTEPGYPLPRTVSR